VFLKYIGGASLMNEGIQAIVQAQQTLNRLIEREKLIVQELDTAESRMIDQIKVVFKSLRMNLSESIEPGQTEKKPVLFTRIPMIKTLSKRILDYFEQGNKDFTTHEMAELFVSNGTYKTIDLSKLNIAPQLSRLGGGGYLKMRW
jgi:hypothetical protein